MVDSISKTHVDRHQATAIVHATFGHGSSLDTFTECDEGWFNAVYRLELGDGTRCILKVAPPPGVPVLRYEHDIITTEVDALRLVHERTDVPVPRVVGWDPSCTLVPSPYIVMEACPGTLLSTMRSSLDTKAQEIIDTQLVRCLASMNAITADEFGRPEPSARHDPTWSGAFTGLVSDLLADAARATVDLPRSYDALQGLVEKHSAHLDVVRIPHLVHWDLWDTNVFVDPRTLAVVGVIDFERVLWGDPLMEAQFVGKRDNDRIVDAYGQPLFDQPYARARRRIYDLYLYLVMTVECAYRNYPTDDIENFARTCLGGVIDEIEKA